MVEHHHQLQNGISNAHINSVIRKPVGAFQGRVGCDHQSNAEWLNCIQYSIDNDHPRVAQTRVSNESKVVFGVTGFYLSDVNN